MKNKITVAVLGSHSALDVCRGAKDEGFKTLVVCQKGREKVYDKYYRSCVDECLILEKFADILNPRVQKSLLAQNAIFIPHRSFEVYLNFNYEAIEKEFKVPIFGNKFLLKVEERAHRPNQYDLLEEAGIRVPKQFSDVHKIDQLCLVKVLEKERGFERAFFLTDGYDDFQKQVAKKIKKGVFTKEQIKTAVIEEFILGVQVNFNFFYSPINQRLELLGTDTRRQTNIEGLGRIPAENQAKIFKRTAIRYEEAGHIAVTILESMLEDVFEMGEKFVQACKKLYPPGIIGPFALQGFILPGPPKKDIVVVDVSPRMPGSPGIFATPYSQYLFGEQISMGRRVAMEIKQARQMKMMNKITS